MAKYIAGDSYGGRQVHPGVGVTAVGEKEKWNVWRERKTPHEMEGMSLIEEGVTLSVPRLHYACARLLSLPFLFFPF